MRSVLDEAADAVLSSLTPALYAPATLLLITWIALRLTLIMSDSRGWDRNLVEEFNPDDLFLWAF